MCSTTQTSDLWTTTENTITSFQIILSETLLLEAEGTNCKKRDAKRTIYTAEKTAEVKKFSDQKPGMNDIFKISKQLRSDIQDVGDKYIKDDSGDLFGGFFWLGFTPFKAEQPLRDMELQEKKHKKITGYRKSV